ITLRNLGRLDEALAHHREALRLDKANLNVLLAYSGALAESGRLTEAAAVLQDAARIHPGLASVHCNLGLVLREMGRFTGALAAFRRGDELVSKDPALRLPSAHWIRDCHRLLELDGRLPAVLKGEAGPRDAGDDLGFAQVCRYKGLHTTAARFYARAFAAGA